MSRESKIFDVTEKKHIKNKVRDYESFGWELLSINGLDVSMSRESQSPVYAELVKFEYEYEELVSQQEELYHRRPIKPAPFNFVLALLLLVIFVLPGVVYIVLAIMKNKKFKQDYEVWDLEMRKLEGEKRRVCNESRSTFFSRQEK
jgi:hypothetical protein